MYKDSCIAYRVLITICSSTYIINLVTSTSLRTIDVASSSTISRNNFYLIITTRFHKSLSSWHKSTKESILSFKPSSSRISLLYGNFHSIEEIQTIILIFVIRSYISNTFSPSRPRYHYFTVSIRNRRCLFMSNISMNHGCNNPRRTRTSTIFF